MISHSVNNLLYRISYDARMVAVDAVVTPFGNNLDAVR